MDDSLAASCSQASVHSAAATGAVNTQKGKGGHISALRSLGLLHELQEYVSACVEVQQAQERELGKLKAEKKEVERVLKQKALKAADKEPHIQQFQASEISDLPPRLRALFEDNKVLKEQVRRYRQRVQEAERHAAALDQQLLAVQAANSKLKVQLHEGAIPHSEAALAQQQVEAMQRALEKLQHSHAVLQQKLDTDARTHRQAISAAAKSRLELEQQVQDLHEQLSARDKECRSLALASKQAAHKLAEVKAVAAKAVAGVNARVAKAVAAVKAEQKQAADARVHLMLCILREPATGSSRQQAARPNVQTVQEVQGAVSSPEAMWADDGLDAQAGSSKCFTSDLNHTREQAAVKLQAGARGYLARKQLRLQQQQHELGLVLVQAGVPPHDTRQAPVSSHGPGDTASSSEAGSSSQASPEAALSMSARQVQLEAATTFSSAHVSDLNVPTELPVHRPDEGAIAAAASTTVSCQTLPSAASAAGRVTPASAGSGSTNAQQSGLADKQHNGRRAASTSRKPAVPVFGRSTVASADSGRATQRESSSQRGGSRVQRS